jgi:hypothetical protein
LPVGVDLAIRKLEKVELEISRENKEPKKFDAI